MSQESTKTGSEGSMTDSINDTIAPPKNRTSIWQKIFRVTFVILAIGVFGLAGYGLIITNPEIINPTSQEIVIKIDNIEYKVPPNSGVVANIKHGEHVVTMSGKELGKFNFGWIDGKSIINPTFSRYVIAEILYGPDSYADKLSNNTISLGTGATYIGPFEIIEKNLYIKKTWDYGVYEQSPSSVTIKGNYKIKKELYTIPKFQKEFASEEEIKEDEDAKQ